MERQSLIKNILLEGLNLPKAADLKPSKINRLIQAFRNDIIKNFPNVYPQIYANGPIISFYDSAQGHGALTIELTFSLVRGPDSIKIKYNVFNPSYMSLETGMIMFKDYIKKVKTYYKIANFIGEHFYAYKDDYRDVKKEDI